MKKLTLLLVIAMLTTQAFSQNLTQTVRGTIVDNDSKSPLLFAQVIIQGADPLIGAVTDVNGNFKLENIPVGRITLQLSYVGYENKTIPNIVVNSGKEVVLNLSMQESAVKLDEVVITAYKRKGEALNEMSLISALSISVEETKRYAGGFSDPSRILSSFAGVTSSQNGENDIIVRGNSPKYVQWRLEGVDISNPTHFGDQNSVKDGISALNNNLFVTSDFYSGAFSPEYGDVLSGVLDIKLRAGNNENFEAAVGFGIVGTDITLEGPFKKGYAGSYLINYRYSTVGLINDLGLVDVDGSLNYQDMTFKVVLHTKKAGVFSFYGLGGSSGFLMQDVQPDGQAIPNNKIWSKDISQDYDKNTHLLNTGMNHTLLINENSYIKTSISYSGTGNTEEVFESTIIEVYDGQSGVLKDSLTDRKQNYNNRLRKSAWRGAITYSNKLNAKNKIQIGIKYSHFIYDYNQSMLQDDKTSDYVYGIYYDMHKAEKCNELILNNGITSVMFETPELGFDNLDGILFPFRSQISKVRIMLNHNDLSFIEQFNNLESLSIVLPRNPKYNLASFNKLKFLSTNWAKNIKGLEETKTLEFIRLEYYGGENLVVLSNNKSVKEIRLVYPRIKTIQGIENLKKLERLNIDYCRKLDELESFSARHKNMRKLNIWESPNLLSCDSIRHLKNLGTLCFGKVMKLSNLDFLRDLKKLTTCAIHPSNLKVSNTDLEFLKALRAKVHHSTLKKSLFMQLHLHYK